MSASDELVNQLTEIIKSSKDFAVAQAPDVARQMIIAELIECGYVLCALVAVILIWRKILGWFKLQKDKDRYFDANDAKALTWVVGTIALAILIPMAFVYCCNSIEALVTPKLFILQQLKHL